MYFVMIHLDTKVWVLGILQIERQGAELGLVLLVDLPSSLPEHGLFDLNRHLDRRE